MVIDDHDMHDDWNISRSWVEDDARRSTGGRSGPSAVYQTYWVYQHLGNLSPAELAKNELYARVRSAEDGYEPNFANSPTTTRTATTECGGAMPRAAGPRG